MKTQIILSALTLSLLVKCLSAQNYAPNIKFEEYRLENGLSVVLQEDQSSPVVTVGIWYKVGSKNEATGKTGLAHLFEHYMFEGDAYSSPSDYFKFIFSMGGTTNANTWYDRTYYYATVPPGGLEEVLRLESNRMATLSEKINQQSLDKQVSIVKNEKRMSDNRPYGEEDTVLDQIGWGDPAHPYSHSVIGSMDDLSSASLEDIKNFHRMYYAPNNAILVVSGRHNPRQTLEMIEKWFAEIPSGPMPPKVKVPHLRPTGYKKVTLTDSKVKSTRVTMAYPFPGKRRPGNIECTVLSALLGSGRSARLINSLQHTKQLVTSIGADIYPLQETGMLVIMATPAPGISPEQVEKAVNAEINLLIKDGIQPGEMERAKISVKTQLINSIQKTQNLNAILAEGKAIGNTGMINDELEEVMRMTPERVLEAAAAYLIRDNKRVIVTVPGN